MKRIYLVLLSLMMLIGIGNRASAQSLTVSGPLFLPQDSIGFTYNSPAFTAKDWIGIYKVGETPGDATPSIIWKYIKTGTGTLNLKAPKEAGKYIAFLLANDGYNIIATSTEFSIEIPSLTTSYPTYVKGDSIVFSFVSPKFSATDKIAIYPDGTKPGASNPPIDSKYIPSSTGSISFKTALNVGSYVAYLFCCDGLDSLSACLFEVVDPAVAFVNAKSLTFTPGVTLEFAYNDPAFISGDWIAIYPYGNPPTGPSITYSLLQSKFGLVKFPGVLASGYYYAILLTASGTEYARSEAFNIPDRGLGSYVQTAASVYPSAASILVNYKDQGFLSTDRLGIYKKGQIPGSIAATAIEPVSKDSSTVEFNAIPLGDYTVCLLCCGGFDIKASFDFSVVGLNTPSIILPAINFIVGDPLPFTYNDPNVATGSTTEWIGIYNVGDIPGPSVRSIVWDYLTTANGTKTFSVPYPLGTLMEGDPTATLPIGEYYAGIFYNDGYGILCQTNFNIVAEGTGISPKLSLSNRLTLFPNPSNGLVTVTLSNTDKLQGIKVYTLTGQVVYEELLSGTVNQKVLDLKLNKGIYLLEVVSDKYKASKKLIIK